MRMLVTGGAGFTCLDDFFAGGRAKVRHLLETGEIYNPACPASPVHCQYSPVGTVKSNGRLMASGKETAPCAS